MNMSKEFPTETRLAFDCMVTCSLLEAAQDFYTTQLGFRLDAIFPADNPGVALLSGYGGHVRLVQSGRTLPQDLKPPPFKPALVVQKYGGQNSWGLGRAGMFYRDLIPGRQGGGFIASHIRIPRGGPVPDYVHHHQVLFQTIYCFKGWVKVVYQDQGPEFVLHEGDCVLQPPGIRHRVLECSEGMEVIELSAPAEHMTFLDHALVLPTTRNKPKRLFGGQRFVRHSAAGSVWIRDALPGFDVKETGIEKGTAGIAALKVLRANGSKLLVGGPAHGRLQFNFVLKGSVHLLLDAESHELQENDVFLIPGGVKWSMTRPAGNFELLQLTVYCYSKGNANSPHSC